MSGPQLDLLGDRTTPIRSEILNTLPDHVIRCHGEGKCPRRGNTCRRITFGSRLAGSHLNPLFFNFPIAGSRYPYKIFMPGL
jgi:hypothetical protein